jgi:hypothetical protein
VILLSFDSLLVGKRIDDDSENRGEHPEQFVASATAMRRIPAAKFPATAD